MDEEFQARINICGENWWSIDSARSVFPALPLSTSSSPCSVAAAAAANDSSTRRQIDDDITGNLKETSTRSCADSAGCYLGCFDAQKLHKSTESASGSGSSILMDSTLQMMGFALTSSSTSANWNHPLFRCNGRPAENNFHNSVLQQELTGIDSPNPQQIQRDYWNPKSFSNQVSTLKPMNQDLINLLDDQQSSLTFPIGATSYGGTTFPSTLSNLYDPDIPQPQPQQYTLFTNRSLSSHSSSKANYGKSSSNELSPIWSKVSTFVKPPPIAKQHPIGGLHFSNNTPFWNASAEALHDMRAGSFASSQSQYQTPSFEEKPNFPNTLSNKLKSEETMDSASMAEKNVCDPALKRQRIETPSTLPTFKVRKEKLGDRVTALQQLVSPFGKTDTASVLYEAIEYIKFLHDQVSVLSTPYMKNGSTIQQQQGCDDMKDCKKGPKQDLRSRGLCLVPISSTFPVATETTTTSADHLWTPTFGGALLRRKKENGKPQPTREEMVMIEEKAEGHKR